MGDDRLRRIVDQAKDLSPDEEKELMRIIRKNCCDHTFNGNGVFVNLSDAGPEALVDIERFLQFSAQKKTELDMYDLMRERMVAADAAASAEPVGPARAYAPEAPPAGGPPVVSAMRKESTRFQALRKKYNRPLDPRGYTSPKLEVESFSE